MKDLAVELWSTLPPELVERTLSFLPVRVLCRFRTVCKRWNSLMCNPEFGALCIQHGRQDACFIILREEKGWSFLDVSARRWYSIQHDDVEVVLGSRSKLIGTDAMDGGLVCQHLYAQDSGDGSVFVSNPIAKTSRRLPSCTAIATTAKPLLGMVVDNIARSYKVFLMLNGTHRDRISADKPFMVIYESITNQWRNSTILHTPVTGLRFHGYHVRCSVFFDGLLYIFISTFPTEIAQDSRLWSYDHIEDVWKNTCVNIPNVELFHMYPQLIVSDNRLFLASWKQKQLLDVCNHNHRDNWTLDGWSYVINEVHLGERTCSTVFEMPVAVMKQVFKVPNTVEQRFSSIHLKAFGFLKSIVLFCMSTEISVVYDLSTSLWELLPRKPRREGHLYEWQGKTMNLVLPASILWAVGSA